MDIQKKISGILAAVVFLSASTVFQHSAFSQDSPFKSQFSDLTGGDIDDGSPEYTLSGNFSVQKGTLAGTLNVSMKLKSGWHGYSQNVLAGQTETAIEIAPDDRFKIVGPFTPDKQPTSTTNTLGEAEEFTGSVTWSAPIEFNEGIDPQQVKIKIDVSGQVCSQSCIPISGEQAKITAEFSKFTQSVGAYFSDHITFNGQLLSKTIAPGDTTNLVFTAKMSPGWHVYRNEEFQQEGTTPQPTIIYFAKTAGFNVGVPIASLEPVQHETGIPGEKYSYYHEDEVQWNLELTAPEGIKPGKYVLAGKVIFQTCTDEGCDPPTSLNFEFPINVGEQSVQDPVQVALVVNQLDRDEMMSESKQFWADQRAANKKVAAIPLADLAFYLVLAFFAGLILNAMPCVLPVIGLKVMSFVQQAGEKRGKIFMLNFVFSLGLLTVFLILATLSAFFGYGWGDLLTKSMTGSIVITSVVFAFGLSMLGVWELPIPGLSGSTSISKKSEEEGLLGAFFLGILTTVLATPCTGPFLISALTITTGQPAWVVYLIFTTIGLGMALPYLTIGVFPNLISWLPRPGAWMNTFKQVTGFILMATVVFLMSSFAGEPRSEYLVAMLSLLLFISIACWWIGRTSLAAEASDQLKAWGTGMAIIAVGGFVAFTYMVPSKYELDWQEFSKVRLGELRDASRLVFIDFTGPN